MGLSFADLGLSFLLSGEEERLTERVKKGESRTSEQKLRWKYREWESEQRRAGVEEQCDV